MKYPYDAVYEPPFPAAPVVLRNSEEGLRTEQVQALLDTGSDGSLVPIAYLEEILAPPMVDTHIRSHWGEWRAVQLFAVDIELGNLRLPSVFVVGDEQGNEIVLGRNVLNRLRLLLDGPAELSDIRS
jgi:predicted aspartyl protease